MDLSRYATLGDNAHISLRSFRTNGEAVDTAVWFCLYDNCHYIRTVRASAKIRRLQTLPSAAIASCRWNGDLLGDWRHVQAEILADEDARIPELDQRMNAFYGDYRRELTTLMQQLKKPLCYICLTPLAASTVDSNQENSAMDDIVNYR
ncbi:MAG: PPOX class probable F420-dependent enzyme [Bacteroidia bacterium]|jgi:PPOX class probable F420-dependent enzyme